MGVIANSRPCILVFGGSFDPVHNGHVSIVKHIIQKLHIDTLRLLPTGQAWQKQATIASAEQRSSMLQLAFENELNIPFTIDQQEIERAKQHMPSYSIDSLRNIRAEVGNECSVALLIGADQLHNLSTWKDWQDLFNLAHIVVAARPGYTLESADLPTELAQILQDKKSTKLEAQEIKNSPFGKLFIEYDLHVDIAATQIRQQLNFADSSQQSKQVSSRLPNKVLNYIQQQHLYY